jgi:hypothetical protein
MQQLHLGETAASHLSNELYAAGIFIGKATCNGLPSLLYSWRGRLVEVVYRVYRSEIAFFHFPADFRDYEQYLPKAEDLV